MEYFAERKSEKLVRINFLLTDKIESVTISGDFFVHPEECLEKIERAITGTGKNELDSISEKIYSVIENYNAEIIGFTPELLQEMMMEAVK